MKLIKRPCQISFLATVFCCNFVNADTMETSSRQSYNFSNLDIDFKASYLYWGVQEDQLAFAVEGLSIFQPATASGFGFERISIFDVEPNSPSPIATTVTHDPQWDSGLRLEGGIHSSCHPIGCNFAWTHFQTKSHASAQNDASEFPSVGITTISAFSNDGGPFLISQGAVSSWNIDINEFTLDFDYRVPLTSCFCFCPYVGVMGTTINQKQNIEYFEVPFNAEIIDLAISRKHDFSGIGPRIGAGFDWKFWRKLSLIGNINTAYLVGRFDTKNEIFAPIDVAAAFLNINEKNVRGRTMAGGLIGLEWESQINKCYGFSISISYEYQYWWQQWHSSSNMLSTFITGESLWGDLSIHGLVTSVGVSF